MSDINQELDELIKDWAENLLDPLMSRREIIHDLIWNKEKKRYRRVEISQEDFRICERALQLIDSGFIQDAAATGVKVNLISEEDDYAYDEPERDLDNDDLSIERVRVCDLHGDVLSTSDSSAPSAPSSATDASQGEDADVLQSTTEEHS